MFSTRIRFILIIGCVVAGVYFAAIGHWYSFFLFSAGFLFLYGHFRYGPVWAAFHAAKTGKLTKAAQLLKEVRYPNLLTSQMRAYFELASAIVSTGREEQSATERHLRTALVHRLRTDNDRALVEVSLAELLVKTERKQEAQVLINAARERKCKSGVAEKIEEVSQSIGSSA